MNLAKTDEVSEGQLTKVTTDGQTYLLTRVGDDYYAIKNSCPHLGLSLAGGTVEDAKLRCPWHGSCFDVRTGENLDWVNAVRGISMPKWTHRMIALGKSPGPITTHKLIVDGGELRLP